MPTHHPPMIRKAELHDLDVIFVLLKEFATSFTADRVAFEQNATQLLQDESAWLGVAEIDGNVVGYCLGFDHLTFYANGRVSWVEEITVQAELRRAGIGHALMSGFEAWAASRGSKLIALATRRASAFYSSIGYEETAICFRKLL